MTTLLPRYGLLLIDIQQGLHQPSHWTAARSTPAFEANVEALLTTFRDVVAPSDIFHVRHHAHSSRPVSPLHPHPGHGHADFMPCAAPRADEPVFATAASSAFLGTGLETAIRGRGITALVVAGLLTDHCVSSTVRTAAGLDIVDGGHILLVCDATATYGRSLGERSFGAEKVHAVQLASLDGEFCQVVTTAQVLMELKIDNWRNDSAVTPDGEDGHVLGG